MGSANLALGQAAVRVLTNHTRRRAHNSPHSAAGMLDALSTLTRANRTDPKTEVQ
jgi:predicted proteasome-type protease